MSSNIKSTSRKRSATTRKVPSKSTNKRTPKTNNSQSTKENRITSYFPVVSRRLLSAKTRIDEHNKNVKYYIETCTDPKTSLIVNEFADKGRGIVTTTLIPKGCFICEYSGDLIKLDEAKV